MCSSVLVRCISTSCSGLRSAAEGVILLLLVAMSTNSIGAPAMNLSRTAVDFGRTPPAVATSVQPLFVTNVGDAPLTIQELVVTGVNASDFSLAGTCAADTVLAPNARCRIDVSMRPPSDALATRRASLAIGSNAIPNPNVVALTGIADSGSAFVAPPDPDPDWLDFGSQPVGTATPHAITVYNFTGLRFIVTEAAITGANGADFSFGSPCFTGTVFPVGTSCPFYVTFAPSAEGPRSAELLVALTYSGITGTYRYSLTGMGGTSGSVPTVSVVEYYNAVLDHYFLTWAQREQDDLDRGNTPTRWTRTGYSFNAYVQPLSNTSPVCRFYLPPQYGDSHFYGRGTLECLQTADKNPAFVLEDPAFMHTFLPNAGTCPAGTTPVYRVFSNRADANHRYMTDKAVRDQMVAKGWLSEGDGPDMIVMCAP